MSQQCAQAARKANHNLRCIKHNIASQLREGIAAIYNALGLTVSTARSFGHHSTKKTRLLESIQVRATKLMKDLEGKMYEE